MKSYFSVIIFLTICFLTGATRVFSQGAVTPFKTIEAETGTLAGGAIIRSMSSMPAAPTPELEASGRSLVELNATGQSVTLTNTTGITSNTIVIRESIPDSPTGGGIDATLNLYVDGIFRQTVSLTSKTTWNYGTYGNWIDNNPVDGTPAHFYDEARTFITGAPIAPGSTITLKKDVGNTAAFYDIDLIDLENAGPAKTQPAGTLSVVTYGATANDATDDTNAFLACVADCQSQGKGMWIPAGTFRTQGLIAANGITISGAGMWYTTINRIIGGRHTWNLTNCIIRDIYIDCPATDVTTAGGHDSGLQTFGATGWLIERVWVHGGGAAFWLSGSNGIIQDCRASSTYGDGINMNNGGLIDPQKAGVNLTCQNNYTRGCLDDGYALNAQNGGGIAGNMVNARFLNNTNVANTFADGMRIAGGRGTVMQNNLIVDPADLHGILIAEYGTAGNPCESALVQGNRIIRGGGFRVYTYGGGIYLNDTVNATVNQNVIIDSYGRGIAMKYCTATFDGNEVIHPASIGFCILPGAVGSGTFTNNTVTDLNSGQPAYLNNAPTTFTTSLTNNSWQVPGTSTLQAEDAQYSGLIADNSQGGYHGTGFISFQNATSDYINWTVNVPVSGNYQLSFRYALPSGSGPLELKVNSVVRAASLSFKATGAWTTWASVNAVQTLNAGNNTIRLTAVGSGGPNMDELVVSPTSAPVSPGTKLAQTISFSVIPNQRKGTSAALVASTNSGLPVTFTSSDPALALVTGNIVYFLDPGTVTLNATQSGDDNFFPIAQSQTLKVTNNLVKVNPGVSPNGDGINDFLTIDCINDFPNNTLTIIDSKGAKMYQATGYNNDTNHFNGRTTPDGRRMDAGSYFYELIVRKNGLSSKFTGYIVLKYD